MATLEFDITQLDVEDILDWVDNAPDWDIKHVREYLETSADMDELTRQLDLFGIAGFIDYYMDHLRYKVPHVFEARKYELEACKNIK